MTGTWLVAKPAHWGKGAEAGAAGGTPFPSAGMRPAPTPRVQGSSQRRRRDPHWPGASPRGSIWEELQREPPHVSWDPKQGVLSCSSSGSWGRGWAGEEGAQQLSKTVQRRSFPRGENTVLEAGGRVGGPGAHGHSSPPTGTGPLSVHGSEELFKNIFSISPNVFFIENT